MSCLCAILLLLLAGTFAFGVAAPANFILNQLQGREMLDAENELAQKESLDFMKLLKNAMENNSSAGDIYQMLTENFVSGLASADEGIIKFLEAMGKSLEVYLEG
jgi:hypothetical protein